MSASATLNLPHVYEQVPYTYVNGKLVWMVWDSQRKTWRLPK